MQLHTYVLKLIYLRSNIKEIYDHHTKHNYAKDHHDPFQMKLLHFVTEE